MTFYRAARCRWRVRNSRRLSEQFCDLSNLDGLHVTRYYGHVVVAFLWNRTVVW